MVQNMKALSYHSTVLPLCFILHNIPIVYKIFSITELHYVLNLMLSVKQKY